MKAYEFEEKIKTVDRELELAASIGFNSIRVFLSFFVWEQEHDGFMERFEKFLNIAAKYNITVMPVFGNDCTLPKRLYTPPVLGPQKVDYGYHGGIAISSLDIHEEAGWSELDEEEGAQGYYRMVDEIVGKYAKDERIIIWDMFNEPGNNRRGTRSLPHMKKFFEIARSHNPIQPLTACAWTLSKKAPIKEIEREALELSDFISYHCYEPYEKSVQVIDLLRDFGRPILNTEWLLRIFSNDIQHLFPLFYLEKVGAYNWGLVAGKNQTYEPWEGIWKRYAEGKGEKYDFTKWQHDLFRINLRPYDPKEIEIIKRYCAFADEKFRG